MRRSPGAQGCGAILVGLGLDVDLRLLGLRLAPPPWVGTATREQMCRGSDHAPPNSKSGGAGASTSFKQSDRVMGGTKGGTEGGHYTEGGFRINETAAGCGDGSKQLDGRKWVNGDRADGEGFFGDYGVSYALPLEQLLAPLRQALIQAARANGTDASVHPLRSLSDVAQVLLGAPLDKASQLQGGGEGWVVG